MRSQYALAIEALKKRFDALRPMSQDALRALDAWYDVELTYTSNAIEGNKLTRIETALVIEKGITTSGKTLVDHNEALDLHSAISAARGIASRNRPITERDILDLHSLVLRRSNPDAAGRYANTSRRIVGSPVILPGPHKVPELMNEFGADLETGTGWMGAFEAHYDLVTIHPFSDGNGRVARLTMNMMLLRDGYPPVIIAPEDRVEYLNVLENRQIAEPLGHGVTDVKTRSDYVRFMSERLMASFKYHIDFLTNETQPDRGISAARDRPGLNAQ